MLNDSRLNTVIVVAIASTLRFGDLPGNVVLKKGEANMPKRCVINVTQIKSVDKGSIREQIGTLSEKRLAEVYQGLEMVTDASHEWVYRGQIIQKNRRVEVDAVITKVEESPVPTIRASGYLKVDELFIYQMENFGLRLVPV